MHPSFNNSAETDKLIPQLIGLNKVGLRFARSCLPRESEFFASIKDAANRITELLLDPSVNGFWVGIQQEGAQADEELHTLLLELNKSRAFAAVCRLSRNGDGSNVKVYDLL